MKNIVSLIACLVISFVLVQHRVSYSDLAGDPPLKVTTWDAMGYYMYLPAIFIYGDYTELKWVDAIESKYSVTGGTMYQAQLHTNGNHVFKYLGGVALLETPFFAIGHLIASNSSYEPDGFSPPYQYSIAFGAILYCILALFLLRKILLRFFDDRVTSITLLLLFLASNLIQYVSIDSAQSHSYIFPLYVLLLYFTIKWHESPKLIWAGFIGLIIGVATICRPTELIMLFIPLLWSTNSKENSKAKWQLVKKNRAHIIAAFLFGLIGIAPQLIYWKMATGSFIYDVGSKWVFLNPYFRVLFGWETGWFIYTPITIFFILGFFYVRKFPFRKSVLVFCLINIWIVIAWSDWKYGSTYSTRALVQSYPVFALPLAAIINRIETNRWRYGFYLVGIYLIYVNFFQISQYNSTILHSRDMNRKYYSHIYLNNNPSPLDMSLLDTDEYLSDESNYQTNTIHSSDSVYEISSKFDSIGSITELHIDTQNDSWVKIDLSLTSFLGHSHSYVNCKTIARNSIKEKRFRLFTPISKSGDQNNYSFFMLIPKNSKETILQLFISTDGTFKGEVEKCRINHFTMLSVPT